jgi:hypothetical protein
MSELLVLQQECDQATQVVAQRLAGCGLQVVRSFDLRQAGKLPAASAAGTNERLTPTPPTGCHCPLHETESCDCQMVIMLVYGQASTPATLMAHGHDGVTWFTLVDTPEQRPLPSLVKSITTALHTPPSPLTLEPTGASYKDSTIR